MVGYRPSGWAPRMSAVATTPESRAAWEQEQRRLEEIEDAAWEQRRLADRDAAAAAQLRAAQLRTAAAVAPPSHAATAAQPQLHYHMPASQAADTPSDSLAPLHPYVWPSPSPPADAPAAASAAVGVPAADRVDNRGRPAFHGPPAPLPAGEVQDGSQTVWNLVGGLRQPGDAGVTRVQQRAAFGPSRLVPFDNSPFRIPTVPSSSPPRPKPMTPPPPPPLPPVSALAVVASSTPGGTLPSLSSVATELRGPPLSVAPAVAEPWTAAQIDAAPWTPARLAAAPSSSVALEMEKAATEAAAAAVAPAPSPAPPSLSGSFPPPLPPGRPGAAAKVNKGKKRREAKTPSAKSAAPPTKRTKKAAGAAGAAGTAAASCDEAGTATAIGSRAHTTEATAAWILVKEDVAKAVRDGNKALWAALKQSTEEIEHLKASTNRLEARVDAQGQGHERTAMAVASVRLAVKNVTDTMGGRKDGGSGSGSAKCSVPVKDEKPVLGRDASKAAAMDLAPANEVKAAELRRPLRQAVKHLVATTNASRDVLMDSAAVTARLNEEAIKVFGMTPSIAHSYLMDFIYFPSASKNAAPTLKRPHTVIVATTSHAVAQLRDFVLKAYFKVLGFGYNPMPRSKAKKWVENDGFLTSYKGEKAVVAAAKNLFNKIGGSYRIVKDTSAGGRFHVDMTVGHFSLIASFVRNEFEIALGRRQRRRQGNGSGTYFYWVDEFTHSIKHLSKNHKDSSIHAGYRITDAIDPDIVVRTTTGGWVFTAPTDSSPALSSVKRVSPTTPATSACHPRSTKRKSAAPRRCPPSPLPATDTAGQGAASRGAGAAPRPATERASPEAMKNCIDDYGVGDDDDGRPSDGSSHAPAAGAVLVVDDDSNDGAGAAMIGLKEDGPGRNVGGNNGVESDGAGARGVGSDEEGSDDVGGRTSSSDGDDSDDGGDSEDEGDESEVDEDDEEEGVY